MSDDSRWAIGRGHGPDFIPIVGLPSFKSAQQAATWAREHQAQLEGDEPVKWRRLTSGGELPSYKDLNPSPESGGASRRAGVP